MVCNTVNAAVPLSGLSLNKLGELQLFGHQFNRCWKWWEVEALVTQTSWYPVELSLRVPLLVLVDLNYYTTTTPIQRPLFWDNLSKPVPER